METEPTVGTPVNLRQRKWDGSPHRQSSMEYLGSDEYGGWLANADGSPFPNNVDPLLLAESRAGRGTHAMFLPRHGCFLAHFNAPPNSATVYTDITTLPEFHHDGSAWVIAAIDMDLDVVLGADGRSWIEDEDEFAEHTDRYGYPDDVVRRMQSTADEVLAAIRNRSEPFGTAWHRWVDRGIS